MLHQRIRLRSRDRPCLYIPWNNQIEQWITVGSREKSVVLGNVQRSIQRRLIRLDPRTIKRSQPRIQKRWSILPSFLNLLQVLSQPQRQLLLRLRTDHSLQDCHGLKGYDVRCNYRTNLGAIHNHRDRGR